MAHWLYPANVKYYDVFEAMKENTVYWPMNSKVIVGDKISIYLAAPHKQIAFLCRVSETDVSFDDALHKVEKYIKGDVDQSKKSKPFMKMHLLRGFKLDEETLLSYKHLKNYGLNGMLMGPRKLDNNPELLTYVEGVIDGL